MIRRTAAFGVLKAQTQQILDFAVLVSIAAPNLELLLNEKSKDDSVQILGSKVFSPSRDPFSTAKRALQRYEGALGATLFTSAFSYFETYFFSVIDEILNFHGGEEEVRKTIHSQLISADYDVATKAALAHLRQFYAKRLNEKYRNASRKLATKKVVWPSTRFMLFGLVEAVRQRDRWKAHDIPRIAIDLLAVDLSGGEGSQFHQLREKRNAIAHGKTLEFDIKEAVEATIFFKSFAAKLDQWIVDEFFIIERFAH